MNDSMDKIILLHGFSREEAMTVMRSVKSGWPDPKELIFATSTPNSVEMKLGDVLADLAEEHQYFREQQAGKNVPGN
jgi:hypothetical protein